ncbi:MAG: branched-chain amino acid ABC transporter permease [Deltaproteobacteria bacterium]|nr:branched-chain amino acid ABC transporter permease [Deltaproteobacteria bacterium]MBW1932814.1 branched-chain amino acid ABC transporter permease [Deltaproteobacteria bacterium]MBW1978898.1 branched-chain amino acid ABC transporter permease [Deltaproteobacteria bacterium]MBW2045347.1 branched-chain amino acid ABC transporter permease [Deltaproteobacteria bacterium]MBW2299001.1 branched-chain amino acid ABC transporter permease [Deltaproteobacteria bacterium]
MGTFKVNYRQDTALFQTLWVKVWLGILVVLLIVSPIFLSRYQISILNEMGIAVIGALGLNLLTGFTGQISLCHGSFLAIGAYTSALLTSKLGIPFWLSFPLSGLMAAALGMIVAVPSLRLKGLYLALGTLAFGFIVEYVIFHWGLTKGDMGMAVRRISIYKFAFRTEKQHFYLITGFAAIAVISAKNIARSKIGRSFVAIRDRDIAAEAMGIPLAKYKVMAFAVSSFYAGVAGCLMAHYQKWIVPGNFDLSVSIAYIAMIIMGGLGTILGSVLGAILITGIPHGIVYLVDIFKESYPGLSGFIVDFKLGLFGLVIVLALLFEPKGLFGIYWRAKIYFKTWPFKY